MTSRPVANWPRAMARRLGMGGDIQFTRAAVGQTLHLPCHAGDHIVDVHIAANQHPDAIAKRLLAQGWTVGTKLKCPDHSRRAPKKNPKKTRLLSEAAPHSVRLSHIADQILNGDIKLKVVDEFPDEDGDFTRNQRCVFKRITDDKPVRPTAEKKEPKKMPEAKQTPVAVPTEAAKRAKRMVYLMLEENYDDVQKRYRAGWNDSKISTETGAHINLVLSVREESFGPLGEPQEFSDLRAMLDAQKQDAEAKIADIKRGLQALETRFNAVCMKNGWPTV